MKAKPKGWWSWTFGIFDNGAEIAEIRLAWMREAGVVQLDDLTYQLYRLPGLHGAFVLDKNGEIIARADKPNAMVRSFTIQHGSSVYTLEAESLFRRRFVLREEGVITGSIFPERILAREALVDLPVELPLPIRLFMVWLMLLLWKREADSAAIVT